MNDDYDHEDMINEIRTVQKTARRLRDRLINAGYMSKGDRTYLEFKRLDNFYYKIVEREIERMNYTLGI